MNFKTKVAKNVYETFREWKTESGDPLLKEFFSRLEIIGNIKPCTDWLEAEIKKLPQSNNEELRRVQALVTWQIGFLQGVGAVYMQETMRSLKEWLK